MTFEEKGDLAFKIAGIAVITGVLPTLPLLFRAVYQALTVADAEGTPSLLLFGLAWPATTALTLGAALLTIFYSRPISRWLVRPHENGATSRAQELIRIGLALVLAFLLLLVASAALAVPFSPTMGAWMAAGFGALTVCLLATRKPLARFLDSRVRVGDRPHADNVSVLAAGIALMGVFRALQEAMQFVSATGIAMRLPPQLPPETMRSWYVWTTVKALLTFVLAAGLVCFAGRFAAGLRRVKGEETVRCAPQHETGGSTYLAAALFVGVAYVFAACLRRLVDSPFFDWQGAEALGALVHLVAVPTVVGAVVFFVAGRCAPRLGDRLWPGGPRAADSDPQATCVLAEVGVAVVALYYAASLLSETVRRGVSFLDGTVSLGPLKILWYRVPVLVAVLGMLALKSDVAWFFGPGRAGVDGLAPERRAAALRPWVVLLGVWLLLRDVPAALASPVAGAFYGSGGRAAPLSGVVGIVLILVAPWLARALSHGRLIPRFFPPRPEAPG